MKHSALALLLAGAAFGAAAQTTYVPVESPAAKPVRFVLGTGVTFGGDKLGTVRYQDDFEIDIHAGGLVDFHAGVDYRVSPEFSLQGTVGYHVDRAPARNGDMRFQRIPFEFLGYYHVNEKLRVGGGLRYVTNAELTSEGASDMGDYDFGNSTGAVAELEYLPMPFFGLKLRYANDRYENKTYGKVKGDHVGVLANFYF